jgi:hypothetical protein
MRDPNLHQAGRLQPCTALSGASAGKSKQCNAGSVHSISLRRRDLLTAGGVTLGSTLLLQSPPPAWALEPPPEGSPALKELYADCQKVCDFVWLMRHHHVIPLFLSHLRPEGPSARQLTRSRRGGCLQVASVLRTAADLDLEGSDASDADIQVYIKLQALPVLKGYVKNYGDRRGRVVLQAKGYSAVPASDAVIGM